MAAGLWVLVFAGPVVPLIFIKAAAGSVEYLRFALVEASEGRVGTLVDHLLLDRAQTGGMRGLIG